MQGKLVLGTAGAVVAAMIGAVIWAAITATTDFQIGYMAIGVGFLAGYAMRTLSGGRKRIEGIIAGGVALLGCVIGNLLVIVVAISRQPEHNSVPNLVVRLAFHPLAAFELLRIEFDWMDLFFYAIAAYAAYRTALAPVRHAPAQPAPSEPDPGR